MQRDAVLEGRYQILGALGQGPQGQVYLVDLLTQPGRRLALKEMALGEADAAARRRFDAEAAGWMAIRHRSLPQVHDFFVHEDAAYLVMDYIPGRTLWDVVAGMPGPPAWTQTAAWLRPVLDLLTVLHQRPDPMVWRELEPSNLLVQPDGTLKLISFGLGRLFSMPEPNPFSAPEEEYGSTDPRSDIYSLGATLYVLMSRHVPPEGWERAAGLARMPAAPGVSPAVMRVLEHMMAVSPDDRPGTVSAAWTELQQALTAAPGDTPATPRPPPQLKWKPKLPVRPPAPGTPPPDAEEEEDVDEETSLRTYLNDVLKEYEKYVRNIGHNELSAPMLLYYRDEVQDTLEALDELKVDTQPFWAYLVDLDALLKENAQTIVNEIGWNNFKQYWIMNDPSPKRWWWYLSRMVPAPTPPPRFWEVWKKK